MVASVKPDTLELVRWVAVACIIVAELTVVAGCSGGGSGGRTRSSTSQAGVDLSRSVSPDVCAALAQDANLQGLSADMRAVATGDASAAQALHEAASHLRSFLPTLGQGAGALADALDRYAEDPLGENAAQSVSDAANRLGKEVQTPCKLPLNG